MKKRKAISIILAGAMTCAALPLSAMHADALATSGYQLGDVDMDGYITGHDAALISKFLYIDNTAMTNNQLLLADINQDGYISQADADQIFESRTVDFVDAGQSGSAMDTLLSQLVLCAYVGAGYSVNPVESSFAEMVSSDVALYCYNAETGEIPQVNYNLMDVNADGVVNTEDVMLTMYSALYFGAGLNDSYYLVDGRYDLNTGMLTDSKMVDDIYNQVDYSIKVSVENTK